MEACPHEDGLLNVKWSTVDSSYSHTTNFQEKCDCKWSMSLSGVPQNSGLDDRKSMAKALHWYINYFQSHVSSEVSLWVAGSLFRSHLGKPLKESLFDVLKIAFASANLF